MSFIDDEDFIRSKVREDIAPFEIDIADKSWRGFSSNDYRDQPLSVHEALRIEATRPRRQHFIENNWRSFHDRNIRLWSRSGINISAFPELPVLDIAIYECVGHVSYNNEEDCCRIMEVIQTIYSMAAFEIISAEESYMDARFIDPVSFSQAQIFQDLILEVAIDVFNDVPLGHESAEDSFEENAVAKAIVEINGFWLHWG